MRKTFVGIRIHPIRVKTLQFVSKTIVFRFGKMQAHKFEGQYIVAVVEYDLGRFCNIFFQNDPPVFHHADRDRSVGEQEIGELSQGRYTVRTDIARCK